VNRLALVLLLALSACAGSKPADQVRRLPVRGEVIDADPEQKRLTLAHEDIPGFMPAMTMAFPVLDPALLKVGEPGDQVSAELVLQPDSRYWLEKVVVTRKAAPGAARKALPRTGPRPGDAVPEAALLDEAGRPLALAALRGRALAITFIFTRCPLPDFCPRLSDTFSRAERLLAAEPDLASQVGLLSISFDPAYDTPAVLAAYAKRHRAGAAPGAWRLATGPQAEVRRVVEFFGLQYQEERGEFVHNLRTGIVDREGRLWRMRSGSDFTAEDVVGDLKAVLAGAPPP
jgi:protein SCO1/2